MSAVPVDGVAWMVTGIELPSAPVHPQAFTVYYADGVNVLARIGVADRSDVPLWD
jgi:hypothetical protein